MNILKSLATRQIEAKKWKERKETFFPLIENTIVMLPTQKAAEKYLVKNYKRLYANKKVYNTPDKMFKALDRLHYEINAVLERHERPFRFGWKSVPLSNTTEEWLLTVNQLEGDAKILRRFYVKKGV